MSAPIDQPLPGIWRFEAAHPEWTPEEGGEEGWDQVVAWWAIGTSRGLLLIDPLVFSWGQLDQMVSDHGGCAGIVRTIHWHQRSVAEAAERFGADVWSGLSRAGVPLAPLDHPLRDGGELWDGMQSFSLERADEIALWLPSQGVLLFADAMLRRKSGELRVCPQSWEQPEGGPARLRTLLGDLMRFPVEHVLVSHGPLVLGRGLESLRAAIG